MPPEFRELAEYNARVADGAAHDPAYAARMADLQAQFDFLIQVRDKLTETMSLVKKIRDMRAQAEQTVQRARNKRQAETGLKALNDKLYPLEERVVQDRGGAGAHAGRPIPAAASVGWCGTTVGVPGAGAGLLRIGGPAAPGWPGGVGTGTKRPSSIRTTRWASRRAAERWVTSRAVRPRSAAPSASTTSSSIAGSRWTVGSSRT